MIAVQGVDLAIASASLSRDAHEWNLANLPGYVEIYLHVTLEELKRRDTKQIYARAERGELKDAAGLDFVVND
jgi:adenylylsulfate kinase-like enzyme